MFNIVVLLISCNADRFEEAEQVCGGEVQGARIGERSVRPRRVDEVRPDQRLEQKQGLVHLVSVESMTSQYSKWCKC
jgi:hypothetical protein